MKISFFVIFMLIGLIILILSLIKEIFKGNTDKCLFFIPKSARAAFEKEMKTRILEPYLLIKAGKQVSYSEMNKHKSLVKKKGAL